MVLFKLNKIETLKNVIDFFCFLYENKINFHPDDDFNDYINSENQKIFDEDTATKYNVLMNEAFEVCETFNEDIYEIGMNLLSDFKIDYLNKKG